MEDQFDRQEYVTSVFAEIVKMNKQLVQSTNDVVSCNILLALISKLLASLYPLVVYLDDDAVERKEYYKIKDNLKKVSLPSVKMESHEAGKSELGFTTLINKTKDTRIMQFDRTMARQDMEDYSKYMSELYCILTDVDGLFHLMYDIDIHSAIQIQEDGMMEEMDNDVKNYSKHGSEK